MRERQFRRFFEEAVRSEEATGDYLLSLLERRLDNVVYRLKFASSRTQARQVIVHGHITVNGKRVSSPSFIVSLNDVVALAEAIRARASFMEAVVAKRMKKAIRPPEWLELDKDGVHGTVLRYPVRSDIKVPIEDHYIVEMYSK
jgi:small subunit ribosomal protein S4